MLLGSISRCTFEDKHLEHAIIRRAHSAHTQPQTNNTPTHVYTLNSNEGQTKLIFHMNIVSVTRFETQYQIYISRQRTENQQINFCKTNAFR